MNENPKVYVSSEDTPEGMRYWAEVIVNAGRIDEQTLYSTSLFDNEAGARYDAKAWLKKHLAK